jgi:hypothetical protein
MAPAVKADEVKLMTWKWDSKSMERMTHESVVHWWDGDHQLSLL